MMIVKRRRVEETFLHPSVKEERPLKIVVGSSYIPKKNKLKPLGEDGHFICTEKDTFGVADGVGGWARQGIDSGKYARRLMRNSVFALIDEPEGDVDPKRVLQEAYSNTKTAGSSTATIITLKNQTLHAANVGDSGFMIYRDKELVYKSPVQQHRFNFPYQLGTSKRSDDPSVAQEIQIKVQAGDIIVAGTDGLLDNIHPNEIEEILTETRGGVWPDKFAWTIAESARFNSEDEDYISPFQVAALAAGRNHRGGKVDDITVVVAMIES